MGGIGGYTVEASSSILSWAAEMGGHTEVDMLHIYTRNNVLVLRCSCEWEVGSLGKWSQPRGEAEFRGQALTTSQTSEPLHHHSSYKPKQHTLIRQYP